MNRTTWLQERRMLKFRDVLSRWEASELSALEASELLGMSERQFRGLSGALRGSGGPACWIGGSGRPRSAGF